MIDQSVVKALMITASIYGKEFDQDSASLLASDLEGYSPENILKALSRCRKELRTFPTVADILSRIDDGRPGPEEAWAMIPKDEFASVVWNNEISEAYGICRKLMNDDMVAARMAFKEAYSRIISDARASGRKPNWIPSLGHEASGREEAIALAVSKGYLTHEQASVYLPEPTMRIEHKGLSGGFTELSDIIKRLQIEYGGGNDVPSPGKDLE